MNLKEPSHLDAVMTGAFGVPTGGQRCDYTVIGYAAASCVAIGCRAVGCIRRFGSSVEPCAVLEGFDTQHNIVADVDVSTAPFWKHVVRTGYLRVDNVVAVAG